MKAKQEKKGELVYLIYTAVSETLTVSFIQNPIGQPEVALLFNARFNTGIE